MRKIPLEGRPYNISLKEINEDVMYSKSIPYRTMLVEYYRKIYKALSDKEFNTKILREILNTFTWADTSDRDYWADRYENPYALDEYDLQAIQTAFERDLSFIKPEKKLEGIEEAFL